MKQPLQNPPGATPTLTVLAASNFVGKTWRPGFDGLPVSSTLFGNTWHAARVPWVGITALFDLLDDTAAAGCCCVVHGQPAPGVVWPAARNNNNLPDTGAWYVCLDIDASHLPDTAPERVRATLPAPLCRGGCWWQRTASAGMKPGLRMRLVFGLTAPVRCAAWAVFWKNNTLGVDRVLWIPSQPIFLAHPRFVGVTDPVGVSQRQGRLAGPLVDPAPVLAAVAHAAQPKPPRRPMVGADAAGLYRYFMGTLRGCIGDVGAALKGERQLVLVSRAARIVGVALAANVAPQGGLDALRAVALQQRPDDHWDIDRALQWALDNVDEPQHPSPRGTK